MRFPRNNLHTGGHEIGDECSRNWSVSRCENRRQQKLLRHMHGPSVLGTVDRPVSRLTACAHVHPQVRRAQAGSAVSYLTSVAISTRQN